MSQPAADRNLLFGILALQLDFISRHALIAAMNGWVLQKATPVGEILVQQGGLTAERHALLEALVTEHLRQHDNDAEKSLAAVPANRALCEDLAAIADGDVHASLQHVVGDRRDGEATTLSVGMATEAGGRFRILRPHAKGGLGEVFLAHDEELHREVALKQMQEHRADDPASRCRFLVEAEITGGLEHPGIVPVYGLGSYADGRPFYAMRFIRGQSLRDAIKTFYAAAMPMVGADSMYTGVEFRKLLGRFEDVCQAIQYAHDRGILHRDLKPGNIMLGPYGETLVVDWGLAKASGAWRVKGGETGAALEAEAPLVPASGSGVADTIAGQAIGTPQYMSPEQAAGRLDQLGPASDVYCLGATLYCLLTGQAPFDRDEQLGPLLDQIQRGDFPPPRQIRPDVPHALQAICVKAMATRPADRYARPQELAEDIERWLADDPVTAWPEPVLVRAGRWVRRHKPMVSGAAAALLVGVIAVSAGAVWYQEEQARQAQAELVRQSEAERQRLLTEQGIDQALKQSGKLRGELHDELRKPGGVQDLLNQASRWEAFIKSAEPELALARHLAARGGDDLDLTWATRIEQAEHALKQDDADRLLALRLEKIRMDKAISIDGQFSRRAEQDYPEAFAKAGMTVAPDRLEAVAAQIRLSAIKEQLLAALDDWAWVAHFSHNKDGGFRPLQALARVADPDPWRDRVRDPAVWLQRGAVLTLAKEVQADPERFAEQSPQMLVFVHLLLPPMNKEKWLRQAQALHPQDFWINFHLGSVLRDRADKWEAIGFFRAALAIRPNAAVVYANLAVSLRAQNDLPATIEAYRKAVAIDPRYTVAWNNLSGALLDHGDVAAAVEAVRKCTVLEPTKSKWWNNLGHALIAHKEFPAAALACKKAVDLDDRNAIAWNSLGRALYAQLDLPGAIAAYEKSIAIDGGAAHVWSNLGLARYDRKDAPGAIAAYKEALARDSNSAPTWNNLGAAQSDQHDLPAAIDAFEKALAINPQYANAWSNLGAARGRQKNHVAAIAAYKRAVEINPKFAAAWNSLGAALRTRKELPAAVEAFQKAVEIEPCFANAWTNLARARRDQKDQRGALDAAKKAVECDPKAIEAWHEVGLALEAQQDTRSAIDAYQKVLALDPKSIPALNSLGMCLDAEKDLPAAIATLKKALKIAPDHVLLRNNLGYVLLHQPDLIGAIDAFHRALDIDPNFKLSWNNLGQALALQQKDLPAAALAYTKILQAHPKNARAWVDLGNIRYLQNDRMAALDAYKKALAIDPNSDLAWYNLSRVLNAQGEVAAAIEAVRKTLQLKPNAGYAYASLAVGLRRQGDFAGAVRAMQRAQELLPEGHGIRPNVDKELREYQKLAALEQRLPAALKGERVSAAERLALAEMCLQYKKRYRDAAELYARAFADEPKWAEDLAKYYRYNAACAAAQAGAGDLPDAEKARMRQQALDWLTADLAARRKLMAQNPQDAGQIHKDLTHWQEDTDLAGVRDAKALARLSATERDAWRQLWQDVATASRTAP